MTDLPPEAAELFRGTPDGFVAARDTLAASLREADRADEAAAVKALRKPTLPVWALDQLAHLDPDGVTELLAAGAELRSAQQATLSSADAAERLRGATASRREVVAQLTTAAVGALDSIGAAGATQRDKIAGALENASIEPTASARLETGTLTSLPAAPGGFGDVFGLAAVPDLPAGSTKQRRPATTTKPDAVKLRRMRDHAAKAAARDRAAADRVARDLAQAREKVTTLEADHAAAEAKALESEAAAKRADKELGRSRSR